MKVRYIIGIALLALAGIYFYLLNPFAKSGIEKTDDSLPEVEIMGSQFKHYLSDNRELIMDSKQVNLYKTENKVTFGKNKGKILEDKKDKMEFEGKDGVFYMDTRNIALKGDVKARTVEGKRLTADEAVYDPEKDELVCTGHVVYKDGERVMNSDKAVTDSGFKKVIATGHVKLYKEEDVIK